MIGNIKAEEEVIGNLADNENEKFKKIYCNAYEKTGSRHSARKCHKLTTAMKKQAKTEEDEAKAYVRRNTDRAESKSHIKRRIMTLSMHKDLVRKVVTSALRKEIGNPETCGGENSIDRRTKKKLAKLKKCSYSLHTVLSYICWWEINWKCS